MDLRLTERHDGHAFVRCTHWKALNKPECAIDRQGLEEPAMEQATLVELERDLKKRGTRRGLFLEKKDG